MQTLDYSRSTLTFRIDTLESEGRIEGAATREGVFLVNNLLFVLLTFGDGMSLWDLAAGIRLWGLFHDLPFSYFGDELHFMKRSAALGTGDLNPHWFHKPALLMYVLAFVDGLYYLVGRLTGQFDSTAAFGAAFQVWTYIQMPAFAIGMAVSSMAAFIERVIVSAYMIT